MAGADRGRKKSQMGVLSTNAHGRPLCTGTVLSAGVLAVNKAKPACNGERHRPIRKHSKVRDH